MHECRTKNNTFILIYGNENKQIRLSLLIAFQSENSPIETNC